MTLLLHTEASSKRDTFGIPLLLINDTYCGNYE